MTSYQESKILIVLLLCSCCVTLSRAGTPNSDLLRLADAGDADACVAAADAYISTDNGKRDSAAAARYVQKALAANPSVPNAKAMLALLLFQGQGIPMDRVKARQLLDEAIADDDPGAKQLAQELKKRGHLSGLLPLAAPEPELLTKAENGEAEAQGQLAEAYFNGWIESPEGSNPGREWRERAAENGSGKAQLFLADGYFQGAFGYPKDVARGLRWLKRAADGGYAQASFRAGEIYTEGKLVSRDDKLAAQYLKQAVEGKVQKAETLYGIMLIEGRGVAADFKLGGDLLVGAEKRGDITARRYLLALALSGNLSFSNAAFANRLLEQGVEDGQTKAKAILGIRLYTGQGIAKDPDRASSLLQAAAEEGDFEATKGYLDYLGNRVKELSNATGPLAELKKNQAASYAFRGRDGLVLYGRNGKTEDRLAAARQLTGFVDPQGRELLDEHLRGALALVRIYRNEGGEDRTALRWLEKMEIHFQEKKWKNASGQTAAQVIDEKQRELERFIAAHRP